MAKICPVSLKICSFLNEFARHSYVDDKSFFFFFFHFPARRFRGEPDWGFDGPAVLMEDLVIVEVKSDVHGKKTAYVPAEAKRGLKSFGAGAEAHDTLFREIEK